MGTPFNVNAENAYSIAVSLTFVTLYASLIKDDASFLPLFLNVDLRQNLLPSVEELTEN